MSSWKNLKGYSLNEKDSGSQIMFGFPLEVAAAQFYNAKASRSNVYKVHEHGIQSSLSVVQE